MMRVLHENNIECPLPVLNIHGAEKSLEKLDDEDTVYVVRLLTFVPGERVETVPYTSKLIYQLGETLASVNNALQGLDHPALNEFSKIWSLSSVPQLRQFTYAVDDVAKRQLVLDVIDAFECEVLPNTAQFSAGVIHGDFNEKNIIVRREPQSAAVTIGVIDFGDSEVGPYLFDVAIAAAYCMVQGEAAVDPVDACGHLLAGYLDGRRRALTAVERAALWPCVAARLAQSLTLGAYTYSMDPCNEYVLDSARRGWTLLRRLWRETSRQQLETQLDSLLASYDCIN